MSVFTTTAVNTLPQTDISSFILIGDNIDKTVRPRHMSMAHQSQSLHYFQFYAALDRIDFRSLVNDTPIGDVSALPLSTFLPSLADSAALKENYAILIAREIVKKLPYFKVFEDCVPDHIQHEYSANMCMKSSIVSS